MSIIRAARPQSNFYILDKSISEDKRLTWGARGLLVFLLGKPDHWQVSIQALINETDATVKPSRESVVYGYLKELIKVGYVTRKKHQSGAIDYFVSETPGTSPQSPAQQPDRKNPDLGKPDQEKPNLGKPDLDNQALVSTDVVASTETAARTDKRAPRFDAQAHLESLGVDPQIARDYITHRRAKRSAVTVTAIEGIAKEAGKAKLSLQAALKICCERGWQGFKAEWLKGTGTTSQHWSEKNDEFLAKLTGRSRSERDPDFIDV